MKQLLTIAIVAITVAAFSSSTFAGDCGACPATGEKAKDKKEESTQS